jgi:hypothetical protein
MARADAMRRWLLAALLAAVPALAAAENPGKAAATTAPQDAFAAIHGGLETATSSDCLGCHATEAPTIAIHTSHPIDRDYTASAGRRASGLRTREEVERAGLTLDGGKVGCLTCHSLSSPWKHRIAIPRGATALRAVDRADPATYENKPAAAKPGDRVETKPLCQACHAF